MEQVQKNEANPEFSKTPISSSIRLLRRAKYRRMGVKVVHQIYLHEDEANWRKEDDWKRNVIQRFRRRLAASEASVARFVVGGAIDGAHKGADDPRSGVIEEAIQSLGLKRPIYLAGGFGGATHDLGTALGLSTPRIGRPPDSLTNGLTRDQKLWLCEISSRLRPAPHTKLPVSPEEQFLFLSDHAFGGPLWPDNGLSLEENRELFHSEKSNTVQKLVIKGLRRVFSERRPDPLPLKWSVLRSGFGPEEDRDGEREAQA
jgi:SLOG cluster2